MGESSIAGMPVEYAIARPIVTSHADRGGHAFGVARLPQVRPAVVGTRPPAGAIRVRIAPGIRRASPIVAAALRACR